jgi:thiamine biosynthesis lipoprotein
MNLSSNTEIRRCRPLLGTFVEVKASGLSEVRLQQAVDSAFAAIQHIHNLMSVHDPDSELSRVNREAVFHPVSVSRETFVVLVRALKLAHESRGAFDPAIAPVLALWGLLPAVLRRKKAGTWRDVLLLPGRNIQFLRPLALDLGGIAKGFAVDAAIKTLRQYKVQSAVVNAGGDLRVFGDQPSTIYLRHPTQPQLFARTIKLRDCAVATSSPCFTECQWRGTRVSHLVNPVARSAITGPTSGFG